MATPLIIDTDPGVDYAFAIALAARSPEVELVGLTTVFGNVGLDLTTRNAQRLLAYLVLHPRTAHRREALVDLLWGDVPADQGRRALSDTIYRLRASSRRWLRAEHEVVALERPLWTDVWEFDRLIASADPDDLAAAVDLYGADLAPAVYDDWIIGHRSARRNHRPRRGRQPDGTPNRAQARARPRRPPSAPRSASSRPR